MNGVQWLGECLHTRTLRGLCGGCKTPASAILVLSFPELSFDSLHHLWAGFFKAGHPYDSSTAVGAGVDPCRRIQTLLLGLSIGWDGSVPQPTGGRSR